MDRRLQETILRGDTQAFHTLIQEDENIINQTLPGSSNTILHLIARYGHVELAAEIVKLRPELVAAENDSMETPLHEACREGRSEIMRVLVETDPWLVYKFNTRGQSVLFVACERGRLDVVKHLLNYPVLLTSEVDALTTSLHVAASGGHTDIMKLILQARPDFARKKDINGCTPLHLCCSKGHLDITRELLRLDPNLSCLQDNEGRTPLHWAAIKGRVAIIDEILSVSLESTEIITKHGETVLHLAVKNNQYDAVKYLTETLNIIKLINLPDNDGNTLLHMATAGKLSTMVIYLLKMGIDVNAINRKGYTALDVVESDASNSGALLIIPALQEAGAKRCDQLGPFSREIQQVYENINSPTIEHYSPKLPDSRHRHHHHHRRRRAKQLEIQKEGLRNARNTITVVAVLIATVTFAAGINPPGGFNQQSGKTILGKQTSFKVFFVCNIVALFLSLGIVIFLVSIIPYKRKSMMKLLVVTHKAMWVALSFMAAAYIAAVWTVLPRGRPGMVWVLVAVVGIGGGCTLAIFVGLGMLLAKHWIRKWEWKRSKEKKRESPNSSISHVEELRTMKNGNNDYSSNSDVDSSDQGYHLY
ncbi:putative Ankyrin repeat family protein [Tripterygium wilfordii]|uniref:Putative Ankyrin repeat family protein n=1 Tax=Tripterygium wilfordii TaxID=458696 RepID=A0A7J7DPG2_TRIWF|nr:ankyrin repeat-containing protein ITN1-like [Tripterygium wilfordii]KAF5748260.1 putative Ankyrin repeat family protein [Tripterygium wilfordii]